MATRVQVSLIEQAAKLIEANRDETNEYCLVLFDDVDEKVVLLDREESTIAQEDYE